MIADPQAGGHTPALHTDRVVEQASRREQLVQRA